MAKFLNKIRTVKFDIYVSNKKWISMYTCLKGETNFISIEIYLAQKGDR